MSGLSVPSSRVYNGTTTATVSGSPGSLQTAETGGTGTTSDGKPYIGDAVGITGPATGTYNSLNVATASSVTYGGLSLTGAQAGDYSLTIQSPAPATITPATLTYVATPASQAYGSANTVFTGNVTGFVPGDSQASATAGTPAFTSTTTTNSPVGSYAIDGSGLSATNYTFVQAGGNATALTITKAPLSITASAQSKTYGQTVAFGSGSTNFTSSGLQNGETIGTVTLTCSGGASNAPVSGSPYTITPSAATGETFNPADYTIIYNTNSLTLTPLAVVLRGTKTYDGSTNAAASILSVTNVVGSDDVNAASGSAGLASADIGTHAITSVTNLALGGVTATNYTLAGASGSVTVTPLAVVLTGTRLYDGTATAAFGILSVSNAVGSDAVNVASGSATLAGADVGTNAITSVTNLTLGGVTATNYTLTSASGSVTITGVPLSITANPVSKTYGTALTLDPTAFAVGSGLVGSELVTAVTMTANGGTAASGPVSGSPYTITPSLATGTGGFLAANYSINVQHQQPDGDPAGGGIGGHPSV